MAISQRVLGAESRANGEVVDHGASAWRGRLDEWRQLVLTRQDAVDTAVLYLYDLHWKLGGTCNLYTNYCGPRVRAA
jgi:hypothetical protein